MPVDGVVRIKVPTPYEVGPVNVYVLLGEAPTLVLAVVVAFQWFRREERETARHDRQADRDGDAELRAYNARLEQLRQEAERLR